MAEQNFSIFATFFALCFLCFITDINGLIRPEDNIIQEGELKGQEADMYDWSKHPCRRECKDKEPPKLCYYQFLVEEYLSMSKACYNCPYNISDCFRKQCISVDGNQRYVVVVNRQLPGPAIEVCHGDTIKVKVINLMLSESITIHWHGINQKDTPYMDGVPFVTQCPISMNSVFTYEFNATESGTHFWHSHLGGQRADGLFGTLIVRPKTKDNPHKTLYDYDEHSMIVLDWKERDPERQYIVLVNHASPLESPTTLLVNGLARNKEFKTESGETIYTPEAVFKVKQGFKYRFRFINSGAENCPLEMSIDNHTMTVISTDSHDIEPIEVDVIHSWPGERYDFIVNADQKVDNYWIRYRGNGKLCNKSTAKRLHQVAILRYEGAELVEPKSPIDPNLPNNPNARELNPYEKGTESPEAISMPQLKALEPDDPSNTPGEPDLRVYLNLDFYRVNNYDFHRDGVAGYNEAPTDTRTGTFQFNYISFHFPRFPFLTQREDVLPSMSCDEQSFLNKQECIQNQCICTHVIKVPLNAVVELFLIDEGVFDITNHPMHLHGHPFRVVATKKLTSPITRKELIQMDKNGEIYREFNRTVLKDTMKVPSGGYTIVRFYANNPGYWFYHCHFEQHIELGLALIFKVGQHEDMVPTPKNFPTCGRVYP